MHSQFTSYDQLPITLTADHIAAALGISRANAYILLRSDGFPTLHIGKRTADAAKPMSFSALPYTPHEMENAKHPYELPPVHYTVIRAIGEQMGVGGDDSWGANVHPEYIPDVTKPVEFTFTFRGI